MYWPTSAARTLSLPPPLDCSPLIRIKSSRKGNFFAVLAKDGLGVWDVRPTVLQTVAARSGDDVTRWGENVDVFWSHDGRGLIVLTSTSHLLFYQLVSTSETCFSFPRSTTFPSGGAGEGDDLYGWRLEPKGVTFLMGGCESILAQPHNLLITLRHPPSILSVPYPIAPTFLTAAENHFPPIPLDGEDCDVWDLTRGKGWLSYANEPPVPQTLGYHKTPGLPGLFTLLTGNGCVYSMTSGIPAIHRSVESLPPTPLYSDTPSDMVARSLNGSSSFHSSTLRFSGERVYPPLDPHAVDQVIRGVEALGLVEDPPEIIKPPLPAPEDKAVEVSTNSRFGLVAVGTASGKVHIISVPPHPQPSRLSHSLDLMHSANLRSSPGKLTCLSWTSDGYSLGVGYERGWAVWSMGGRLGGWGMIEEDAKNKSESEGFMRGILDLFWSPGNLELFVLSPNQEDQNQLFSIPFAKSATTTQHSPDNTRYAFLQMDDRVLVYRGADQPDMSVINPDSDVWQHIKIPNAYISVNWPIRYASISSDGKLIAVAGRRGLTHYSAASGRWKLFEDERVERGFAVRGGLLWFHHVLVVAVEIGKTYQIRLYSRDLDLDDANILHSQNLPAPVLVMSLLDNSLLVYTSDNTLYHFLILPTRETIKLHLCGSISFAGIVLVPNRVRALSWLIPSPQKRLGNPSDDLVVATIIFLVDGKLILLRPRRAGNDEVRYDMQVLADRIEAYWTHLHGVGTLENSLWGYDGKSMRVWLDALTIEATKVDSIKDTYESVEESVNLVLDFYPLSILMDKGIIIGVDYETSTRSLPFTLFKIQTGTHLFLPKFLRYHLQSSNLSQALSLATNYSTLVYFAHSLEILLHSVLEDEVDTGIKILPLVIEFLDYFPESLDVVVGCARKTEVERWDLLFEIVGKPRELFERCLEKGGGSLRTAASYLLVMHSQEDDEDTVDTIRLLRKALDAGEFHLCKELLRFLHSIDESGKALQIAIEEIGILPPPPPAVATIMVTEAEPASPPSMLSAPSLRPPDTITSPFQLTSPRLWESPPSPRTVNGSQMEDGVPVPVPDEEG
ncbi:RAB6A-GEF complex partner protein 1, partial [Tremellales sp. Uapishka_1]